MVNDEELQRKKFLENKREYFKDRFSFGNCFRKFPMNTILKMLDMIDEGYFPFGFLALNMDKERQLKTYGLEKYKYKEIPSSSNYSKLYFKISDIENYFSKKGVQHNYFDGSFSYPLGVSRGEMFNLLKQKKVYIGMMPDSIGDVQLMTTDEARTHMANVMEELFQEDWARRKEWRRTHRR